MDSSFLREWRVAGGESLDELSRRGPALIVCLRHGGCPFCRQTLAELAARRAELEAAGVAIVLVHLMRDEEARELFARFGLDDLPRIADPEGRLYETLGLLRASLRQVMGPKAWWHGTKAVLRGNRPGMPRGDIFRLPGAFLIFAGQVARMTADGGTTHARPDIDAVLAQITPKSSSRM
ncbi:MAG: AhpC/TSA family protein [Planctomycetales bacterium]